LSTPKRPVAFSLCLFLLLILGQAKGEITTLNAGGNCKYPTFMLNPQYRLSISAPQERTAKINASKATISFSLRAGKDLPVNLTAVWSNGQRVAEYVFYITLDPLEAELGPDFLKKMWSLRLGHIHMAWQEPVKNSLVCWPRFDILFAHTFQLANIQS